MKKIVFISFSFLASAGVLALMLYFNSAVIETMGNNDNSNKPLIIIDAGHGGADGGAESRTGLMEKDINLSIALMLKSYLSFSGFEVIMTREDDKSLHSEENDDTLRMQKVSDLKNRLSLVRKNPNSIFISIHQNSFPSQRENGAQVFYSPNDPKSTALGETIQSSLVDVLDKNNRRKAKISNDSIFLLKNINSPAILVECGFMTNDEEVQKLCDSQYQSKTAYAIFCGVVDYLSAEHLNNGEKENEN